MKRDFGRRLVEDFFPTVDLTDVIDTSGAYIPGHGTPTVLLFGRNRPPITDHVKAILGVRGEPCAPLDPAKGLVWTAIKDCIDNVDAGGGFVTATDTSRTVFAKHPWSIGGGGAADLRVLLDSHAATSLGEHADIGYLVVTGEDGCLLLSKSTFQRHGISQITPLADGEALRDWQWRSEDAVLWPYETDGSALRPELLGKLLTFLWPYRETLRQRKAFGVPVEQKGLSWWDLREVYRHRLVDPRAIPFAFVATHNHFVFSRGGSVFKQSSPVINLSATATEADYLGLLGLLNSSTSAFWLRQVCHNKGGGGIGGGLATETWEQFMEYTSTALEGFPVTPELPAELAGELDQLAQTWQSFLPAPLIKRDGRTRDHLDRARSAADEAFSRMVSLQEELDWQCYRLYGLTEDELTLSGTGGDSLISPPLRLGERAFEIVLSRRVAAGSEETAWFARHGSTPITEIPSHWPAEYRALVERRIALIEQDRNIALIERPEHKRRWNVETWQELERAALDEWLLERLESHTYWPNVALQTTRDLAERASLDSEFGQVAAIRFGEGVALEPAIRELVSNEAVPFLPALRYTASGREKRRVWEQVWTLQRREDVVDAFVAADASFATRREGESQDAFAKRLAGVQKARREVEVGAIPRPPKYAPADFQRAEFWRMRGALDVPKERFIAYQYSGRDGDDAPLLGWAGWNQLQQAEALAGWYADRTSEDGWTGDRVVPLLAGMAELVPWLKQRHNEYDPRFGDRPGEAYSLWLDDALQAHGLTRAALDAWEPPRAARRARKAASRTSA
ncbi:BREX-2 system adenine-specific DNA-methyltransferase PglX [Gemmatimonas sp.]|uniref:BREX-2 system adenine-specific DNA-methyltransferase PglX n=1 Tax=Gemmatimonas sp. TaxID=1962908 RepID=UPI0037C110AD